MNRRAFCAAMAAAALPKKISVVRQLAHPAAIAMWDFSWLLRRHANGGFEDWDRALDELAERGYNAVRIDVFPHLVALAERPGSERQFTFPGRRPGTHALWGNDVEVTVDPRQALTEFIPKCRERNLLVAASTWFRGPKGTADSIRGFEGFTSVWSEALDFMDRHGLLRNILFIDLLNEYPFYNGFQWLKEAAQGASAPATGDEHMQWDTARAIPEGESAFYKQFSTRVLERFRRQFPRYDFCLSLTANWDAFRPARSVDVAAMDVLDAHVWFGHNPIIRRYDMAAAQFTKPGELARRYDSLKSAWTENRAALIAWMDHQLAGHADLARRANAVAGNTEGWGTMGWDDVPPLDWGFIKQSAELCVDLVSRHGYKFICTSNFTHPHFKRLWEDVAWHRSITARIRSCT